MTANVLHDRVMRTVYFSLLAAIAVFVGMLLLTMKRGRVSCEWSTRRILS
jgi:hypothetical protein